MRFNLWVKRLSSVVQTAEVNQQISSDVFGLSPAIIRCNESTTLDDFRDGLLIEGRPDEDNSSIRAHGVEVEPAAVGGPIRIMQMT